CHGGSDDFEDTLGAFLGSEAELVSELLHTFVRCVIIQVKSTTEQTGSESAQHNVGIGDGELRATPLIRDRSRDSSRAVRAHPETSTGVTPGDGPTTGADGV